ncbi:MAG: hypothetical protein CME04_06225 [Gemmatimonadaceae bacterium]|nr:hypothetical protein [Gemmatimonadaceae bacterium]
MALTGDGPGTDCHLCGQAPTVEDEAAQQVGGGDEEIGGAQASGTHPDRSGNTAMVMEKLPGVGSGLNKGFAGNRTACRQGWRHPPRRTVGCVV